MRSQVKHPQSAHLRALAAYSLITVLMTWPTVLHLADGIPGDGFDGWQNYWNLWWVKEALLVLGTNPYFTDYLYPPLGTNLLFHTLNIFNGLWTLPLQLNFGLAIAYNSVVFFSFVFAGYGGYLLSLYTLSQTNLSGQTAIRLAAFAGGLVFTMSPFHMAHLLGHMQVFSMVWPPLYILSLIRTLQPRAGGPGRNTWRDSALACLFLILATLVDWYHMLYLLIFTSIAVMWTIGLRWRRLSTRRRSTNGSRQGLFSHPLFQTLWPVLAIGLGFVVILSPLLIPMILEATARPDLETGLAQNITLSADLLAFFTPSEMHPLWGAWAKTIAGTFTTTTSERLIFAGFVPLALTIYAITRQWHQIVVKFWTLVVLLFFLLALGPFLHIGGKMVTLGSWPIPMPYLLLYNTVPFIGLTRSLSRYDLMVMLGLGVLVAIALASITNYQLSKKLDAKPDARRPTFQVFTWLPILAILFICFEFVPVPYPISKIETPRFYFDLAGQSEDYTIAELPMNWDRPTPLLQQTVHQKRLLTAYTSRHNPRELAWRTPVLQHWRNLGPDIIHQPLDLIGPTIFFDFNLRYIVLDYWQMPPGPEREGTERWVAAALPDAVPIYDDGRLKVYQSPPKTETQPYLSLGEGWSDRRESDAGLVSRTFSAATAAPAELFLHHPQNLALSLEITAAGSSSDGLHPVTVRADDQPVATLEITQSYSTKIITLPKFAEDVVKLTFEAADPSNAVTVRRVGFASTRN